MNINILDLSLPEFEDIIVNIGEKKFRAKQIFDWIYKKNNLNLDSMSNIPSSLIEKLKPDFSIETLSIHKINHSKLDNSYKFLLKTKDNNLIEAILMLTNNRVTLCVSSMIGCPLKCKFCASGSELKFKRNLKTSEIMGQFITIQNFIQKNNIADKITNIVFMGMGEPLLNIVNIDKTLLLLTDDNSFGLSKRKISISTAGVTKGLSELINKYGVNLAVSVHFPSDKQRSKFMPINDKISLPQLIKELKKIKLGKRDYITIEYLMIDKINDTLVHAEMLQKLFSSLKIKINLIPYNPIKTFPENPSEEKQIDIFANYLRSKSIFVTVRRSKGSETQGACGQFVLKS